MHNLDNGKIYNYDTQSWDTIQPSTDVHRQGDTSAIVYTTAAGTDYELDPTGTKYRNV